MGTHSIIRCWIKPSYKYEKPLLLLVIYQQFDGYLEGVGEKLALWLKEFKIVNGLPLDPYPTEFRLANGAECLFAQLVADWKKGPGNLYIYDHNARNEEFNYDIFVCDNVITIGYNKVEYTIDEFLEKINKNKNKKINKN